MIVFDLKTKTSSEIFVDVEGFKNPRIDRFIAENNTIILKIFGKNIISVSYDNGISFKNQKFPAVIKDIFITDAINDKIVIRDSKGNVNII